VFPELINLSLCFCTFAAEDSRLSAAKLKHLVFIGYGRALPQPLSTFLDDSVSSFASLTINARQIPFLPPSVFASPSPSILFHLYPDEEPIACAYSPKNLYFSFFSGDFFAPSSRDDREVEGIESWTSFILYSEHSLETITVAVLSGGGGGGIETLMPAHRAAAIALVAACHEKGIKVYFEEPGGGQTFAELVPPWFIQKSEALQAAPCGE